MEAVRRTTSSEGADLDLDGLGQLILPGGGDNAWPEAIIDAPSFPTLFASPPIFLSDSTTATATTNSCLGQPGVTLASEGAMADVGSPDQLVSSDNASAAIDSSSFSFFAPPSTFLLDATTNGSAPAASANTSSIQPSISTMSWEGIEIDLDGLGQELLPGDNTWIQPSISTASSQGEAIDLDLMEHLLSGDVPVPRNTPSEGAAVDPDHLVEQPLSLSGDIPWPELTTDASSPPSFFTHLSFFPSDSQTIMAPNSKPSSAYTNPGYYMSKRLGPAINHISESLFQTYRCKDVHVQVWVPAKCRHGDGRLVYSLSQPGKPQLITNFVSRPLGLFMTNQLITNVVSTPVGLPGGVFMTKFYISGEPVSEAQSGHETLGLQVFQKVSGVIELIMPTQELNLTVDTISRALQAVNLTDTNVPIIPRLKLNGASYIDASPEILQVLRAACVIHELPLAQTWATCAQQGKRCKRHADENCLYCICTIDVACYVNDPRMQIFHEACSEHHLLPGQGVVGKAFTTNQPCFLPDIGSSSEQEYPLSNHAKIFKLKGAVAIRLRCTHTGMADFVLEFFLPTDCGVLEEQKAVLDSLWGTVRSVSRTLRMVTDKEMEEDAVREMNEINSLGLQKNKKPMKRKRMARRSAVWNDFTEVMVGDTVKAKCNHCGLELCCDPKTHGTSSLANHLKICILNPNRIMGPI